ncbi:hypothetical protein C4D60_Mb08t14970 [Musa balbisiana]|uniref:Phosphoesterase family protein n=1 Tax=Musa balbisiana TaxID=52838 RepID=A0A4S8K3V7_MUSBA|nr:hypothetical protein C4D60_Mb08t14970 [Musa balbisiana]
MKSINPGIDGVSNDRELSNPLSTSDRNSSLVYFGNQSVYVDPDPGHSIQAIYEQIYGVPFTAGVTPITPPGIDSPPMNGFVQQAEKEKPGMSSIVMNGFKPEAVPVYESLVREFAVCDRWFASMPASTQPNRLFVHSATSHGFTSNDTKKLVADDLVYSGRQAVINPRMTIPESVINLLLSSIPVNCSFDSATTVCVHACMHVTSDVDDDDRNLRQLKYVGNFHPFDLKFKKHCKKGKLPNYVVIEQRYFDLKLLPGNDDHPSHDVSEGQKLVKEVYEALRSSPQWNEILFVIIYDEHGGFFDHVPTPVRVPSPDDIVGPEPFYFKFDRLGVRVPTLFISPWIEPGTVVHRPSGPHPTSEFEHSSIPATVKKIFNLKDFLTKRDEWAGTFETVLTRTTPRTDCPEILPEPRKLRPTEAAETAKLSEFQTELVHLGAVLNGDHAKDIYPHKLVENMTVADGAQYVQNALKTFFEECENCRNNGFDGSHVVVVNPPARDATVQDTRSSLQKMLSCLLCNWS